MNHFERLSAILAEVVSENVLRKIEQAVRADQKKEV